MSNEQLNCTCRMCGREFVEEVDDTWEGNSKIELKGSSSRTLFIFTKELECPGCHAKGTFTLTYESPGIHERGLDQSVIATCQKCKCEFETPKGDFRMTPGEIKKKRFSHVKLIPFSKEVQCPQCHVNGTYTFTIREE